MYIFYIFYFYSNFDLGVRIENGMGVNLIINFIVEFEIILCGLNLCNYFDIWGLYKINGIFFLY